MDRKKKQPGTLVLPRHVATEFFLHCLFDLNHNSIFFI